MLILEGGAAGHMMHPYENPDLEFSKMMDIIRAAAGGFQGINVTEKIDGQNTILIRKNLWRFAIKPIRLPVA